MRSPQIFIYALVFVILVALIIGVVISLSQLNGKFDQFESVLSTEADKVGVALGNLETYMANQFQQAWSAIDTAVTRMAVGLEGATKRLLAAMATRLDKFFAGFGAWVIQAGTALEGVIASGITYATKVLENIAGGLAVIVSVVFKAILCNAVKFLRPITSLLCEFFDDTFVFFYDLFATPAHFIETQIVPFFKKVIDFFEDFAASFAPEVKKIVDAVVDAILHPGPIPPIPIPPLSLAKEDAADSAVVSMADATDSDASLQGPIGVLSIQIDEIASKLDSIMPVLDDIRYEFVDPF